VLHLDDLLYVIERIGFALFGLDIFHLYLDRFVHLSFKDRQGFLPRLGMEVEIIATPGLLG
jgi:hypothetical protein